MVRNIETFFFGIEKCLKRYIYQYLSWSYLLVETLSDVFLVHTMSHDKYCQQPVTDSLDSTFQISPAHRVKPATAALNCMTAMAASASYAFGKGGDLAGTKGISVMQGPPMLDRSKVRRGAWSDLAARCRLTLLHNVMSALGDNRRTGVSWTQPFTKPPRGSIRPPRLHIPADPVQLQQNTRPYVHARGVH